MSVNVNLNEFSTETINKSNSSNEKKKEIENFFDISSLVDENNRVIGFEFIFNKKKLYYLIDGINGNYIFNKDKKPLKNYAEYFKSVNMNLSDNLYKKMIEISESKSDEYIKKFAYLFYHFIDRSSSQNLSSSTIIKQIILYSTNYLKDAINDYPIMIFEKEKIGITRNGYFLKYSGEAVKKIYINVIHKEEGYLNEIRKAETDSKIYTGTTDNVYSIRKLMSLYEKIESNLKNPINKFLDEILFSNYIDDSIKEDIIIINPNINRSNDFKFYIDSNDNVKEEINKYIAFNSLLRFLSEHMNTIINLANYIFNILTKSDDTKYFYWKKIIDSFKEEYIKSYLNKNSSNIISNILNDFITKSVMNIPTILNSDFSKALYFNFIIKSYTNDYSKIENNTDSILNASLDTNRIIELSRKYSMDNILFNFGNPNNNGMSAFSDFIYEYYCNNIYGIEVTDIKNNYFCDYINNIGRMDDITTQCSVSPLLSYGFYLKEKNSKDSYFIHINPFIRSKFCIGDILKLFKFIDVNDNSYENEYVFIPHFYVTKTNSNSNSINLVYETSSNDNISYNRNNLIRISNGYKYNSGYFYNNNFYIRPEKDLDKNNPSTIEPKIIYYIFRIMKDINLIPKEISDFF